MWPAKPEILENFVKNLTNSNSIDDIPDSYLIKHMIYAMTEAAHDFVEIAKMVYHSHTALHAKGEQLNDIGFSFGVDRKLRTKARHRVILGRSNPVVMDTPVPENFLLTTTAAGGSPVKFTVMPGQNKYIPEGRTEITVLVECEEYGEIGNVPDGAINLVAQAGFDSATQSQLYRKAVDDETDDEYRERILVRKRTPFRGGVPADYERWAIEVPGVSKAKAFRCPRGAGTVDVVIWGQNGDIPDEGLIAETQKRIDSAAPADVPDGGVLICAPDEKSVNIIIKSADVPGDAIGLLRAEIEGYLASKEASLAITYVDLIVTISKVLKNFKLVEPAGNIQLNGREAAKLGELSVIS
jgi:uncharacterized phage protein gp47/JayE